MSDDYLDRFLGVEDELISEPKLAIPDWVRDGNSSKACYEALLRLYEEKKRYIRNHTKKAAYAKKSAYQISKSEVAREIDVKMQAIFHSVNYSSELTKMLDEKNELLLKAKENVITKRYTGNQGKKKDDVLEMLRHSQSEIKRLKGLVVEEVYAMGLQRMPLDVKKKLGLQ
tara:strand:+ start:4641 stop:5153 length:513 start_codon:yes stop_codon:yes gene_type:complete